MDYFKKYIDQISWQIFFCLMVISGISAGAWWLFDNLIGLELPLVLSGTAVVTLFSALVLSLIIAKSVGRPITMLSRAITYKAQPAENFAEPDFHHLRAGRELVTALAQQIYDLADMGSSVNAATQSSDNSELQHVFDLTPQPVIVIGHDDKVKFLNRAGREYLMLTTEPVGKALVDVVNMLFPSESTFESWLKNARHNKVVDHHSWHRVKIDLPENQGSRLFDLSASFAKGNEGGIETVLVLFDQSARYGRDESEISIVSLAVHELRTPLTIMRGYLEVFEDELGPKLDSEALSFLKKINVSAQQLTSFVSNILNVARVEQNQLTLSLREEHWEPLLKSAVADLQQRAQLHDKELHLQIAEGLPTVAVDSVSIVEVINNLVENAIKYSGDSKDIEITCQINKEGLVETAVTDHGIGIPPTILAHLFEKFYRSHRSSSSVGGTGLGLYLSRAILSAHSGTLTVNSKEGEGSTFRFSLQPFTNLSDEAQAAGQDGIMRSAHGWIKNHNVYRR